MRCGTVLSLLAAIAAAELVVFLVVTTIEVWHGHGLASPVNAAIRQWNTQVPFLIMLLYVVVDVFLSFTQSTLLRCVGIVALLLLAWNHIRLNRYISEFNKLMSRIDAVPNGNASVHQPSTSPARRPNGMRKV